MTQVLTVILWAVVGAAGGWLVRWGSLKLARLEGLESGSRPWQVYGPPILAAIAFAVYAFEIASLPVLVVRSIFVLILVQVIFFDFEHHLILDRVMFPSMGLALVAALVGRPWWAGGLFFNRPLVDGTPLFDALAMGVAAGLLFLIIALVGAAIFKSEAMGFGDVQLAFFIGLLLGWPYTFTALFYGVVLAAVGAVVFIVSHRSMRGTIAYGPYLALGTMLLLLQLP